MTENDRNLPPWADEIPEGAFITDGPTYKVGEYFSRFHKDVFPGTTAGDLRYYYYNPVEHGRPSGKSYPLIIFLHGVSNSFEGDVCINYTGAEFFSTEEYQNDFGGAYLLCPLANEVRNNPSGNVTGFWDDEYVVPLFDLINFFIREKMESVSKKIIIGNSAGGNMAFKMVNAYTDFFNALVSVGSGSIPDNVILDRYDEHDVHLFLAMCRHDEIHDFKIEVEPRLSRLKKMRHCFLFTPEWIYSGNHGIQSINFGFEMGQHCLINPIHANLKFDDGSLMDERLPRGLTGWLDDVIHEQ